MSGNELQTTSAQTIHLTCLDPPLTEDLWGCAEHLHLRSLH